MSVSPSDIIDETGKEYSRTNDTDIKEYVNIFIMRSVSDTSQFHNFRIGKISSEKYSKNTLIHEIREMILGKRCSAGRYIRHVTNIQVQKLFIKTHW